MKTGETVVDEKVKLTDEQIGKIQRKTNEIVRRINEGTIKYQDSLDVMQKIIIENESAIHLDVVLGKARIISFKKTWEENGVIHFKVTSDGAIGKEWVERLIKHGFKLSKWAEELLLSTSFRPTTGIEYEIAVLRGNLFTERDRINKKIRNEASMQKLSTPNVEVTCLIREMFSDEELISMGLYWIIAMHKPIKFSKRDISVLCAVRVGDDGWLDANYGGLNDGWSSDVGFAFEVSRTKVV